LGLSQEVSIVIKDQLWRIVESYLKMMKIVILLLKMEARIWNIQIDLVSIKPAKNKIILRVILL